MLQGGRLGGGLAGAGALLGVAGSLLLLLGAAYERLATGLWSAGALLLAAAAWMILVRDDRPPVRVGGWVAILGLLVLAASGVALLSATATVPLFPAGATATVAGLGAAGFALARSERTRTAGGWVLVSAAALLVGLVFAVDPIGEAALATFFGAWIAIGFLATRPG